MHQERITLKEVATKSNVSLGTVHKAIYNKKGISKETRDKILEIAEELGYKVNIAASSLKRHRVIIAVILPDASGSRKHFFQYIWKGIDEAAESFKDFNLQILKIPFSGSYENQLDTLNDTFSSYQNQIDGLVTLAWHESKLNDALNRFSDSKIPVVTINTDAPDSKRITCVSAPSYKAGMLAGEYMGNLLHSQGKVIVIGGQREVKSHQDRVLGFIKSVHSLRPDIEIIELYEYNSEHFHLSSTLKEYLQKFDDILGVFSNNAKNTITMGEVIEEMQLNTRIKSIGSDINDETVDFLNRGIIQGIIYQNPYMQAFNGIKVIFDYIFRGIIPENSIYTEINLVLKSNIEFFII